MLLFFLIRIQGGKCRSLIRIAFSRLRSEVPFSDVILADVLTSFARVFGDVFLLFCCVLVSIPDNKRQTQRNCTDCSSGILLPLVIALPYLWRLRQCLSEYVTNPKLNRHQLYNALKYFTILPVLTFGYLLKQPGHSSSNFIYTMWYV